MGKPTYIYIVLHCIRQYDAYTVYEWTNVQHISLDQNTHISVHSKIKDIGSDFTDSHESTANKCGSLGQQKPF